MRLTVLVMVTTMQSMIHDLLDPASLPDKAEGVSIVQTHISLVFLSDEYVYKIKKPVNLGFLDFSTLKKRRYYCYQEVMLNSRLSKDTYIGVLPVIHDGSSHRIGMGEGRVVDYAVKMKRLPGERLMKSVFLRGELRSEHLEKIGRVLARFHLTSRNSYHIDKFGQPERFKITTDENFAQTEKYIGRTIQRKGFNALEAWTADFYNSKRELFWGRIKAKRMRDCHGDLHMEHICLTEDLLIFDCIEFNRRFRYTDAVCDIAFLLMDLEYHGGNDYSEKLWSFYKEMAGEETDVDALLTFYKVYRAFVRGKVSSFQLDDETIGTQKKREAMQTARRYFNLASSYIG